MSSFEIQSPPTDVPATSPFEEDGHQALVRIEPQLAALSEGELIAVNVDIPRACATVTAALPQIRSLRPAIVEHLPTMDVGVIDALRDYTMALWYAHLMTKRRAAPTGRIVAVFNEAIALRAEMLQQAGALARRGLLDGTKITDIKAGSGYLDTANDVVALSLLFRQSWSAVSNKTVITQEDCERADRVGRELLALIDVGNRPTLDGLTLDQARDRRARCFTLFFRAYDLARHRKPCLRRQPTPRGHIVEHVALAPSLTAPRRRRSIHLVKGQFLRSSVCAACAVAAACAGTATIDEPNADGTTSAGPTPEGRAGGDGGLCRYVAGVGATVGGAGGSPQDGCAQPRWPSVIDAPGPECPVQPPATDDPCGKPFLQCTYGNDFDVDCRTKAICLESGKWGVSSAPCSTPSCCDISIPAIDEECPTTLLACGYPDGTFCGCASECSGIPDERSPTWLWQCDPPPLAGAACPPLAPNQGSGCTELGLSCSYGTCGSSFYVVTTCEAGAWVYSYPLPS